MKRIKHIRLKNFRSHDNTSMDVLRVTFVRGLNRTGKSSIGMGIAMALSGRCDVTDEGGKGFEQLIREGAQMATIALEFDSGDVITMTLDRTAGRSVKIETKNKTIVGTKQANEWIAENIGPPDVISACLSASRFFSMSPGDQSTLLAHVLLPEKLPIEPEVADWLATNHLSLIERPSLFATIEATYKSIGMARTDVSRKIRDLKNIVEPDPVAKSRDDIKRQIATLQEEQTTLNSKLLSITNATTVVERAQHQLEDAKQAIAQYETKLANLPAPLIASQRKQLKTVADLARRHDELRAIIAAEKATLSTINEAIEQLEKANETGICPTCKSTITEETRQAMFTPLLERQNAANATIHRSQKQLTSDGDPLVATRELEADTNNQTERTKLNEVLGQLRERLADCERATTHPADATNETTAEIQARLDTLKPRIVKGLDILVKTVEAEDKMAQYKKQVTERTAAEQHLAELEKLLDYFGPSGIKARLVSERLEVFNNKVNEVLGWWGYQMAFTIDPYIPRISEEGATFSLSPNQLSASEMYRLGIAFAVAMAEWTGFSMVCADAAEILDRNDKWNLAQLLLQSRLGCALILSTGVAGTFEADNTAFYTLSKHDGTTTCNLDAVTEPEAAVCN